MNQISLIQNSEKQLQRLAAQRELYNAAKSLHLLQIILTVILPVALALVALYITSYAVVSAIFGVLSLIVDMSLIDLAITKNKEKAAKIQELFDCDVLELPKSPLKVVDDVTVEVVLQHYNAHAKIASNIEKIRNWYPTRIHELPLHIARIICQRINCWWDSKLRRKYAFILKCICIAVFGSMLLIGYLRDLTLIDVTLIASGLIPLFQFSIKQANDNIEAACRLDQLVQFSISLWEKALNGESVDSLKSDARKLQDEIYEHRKRSPLILNFYYHWFRDKDELLMNKTADILVEEALART